MNKVPTERASESPNCGKCHEPLLSGKPIEGTVNNFNAILNSGKPVVVDFWAPWCNPCIGFAPVFEDAASQSENDVRFVKVDTEAQQSIAAQYQIRSIPTIMVFENGIKKEVINGALPKSQFEQWLRSALNS
jgi:thioredoxin 2